MPSALIVEDEPEANRLLSLLVQLRGYTTQSVFTGNEALESARRSQPDIVFLDLMLPDTNGYDVCRSLKNRRTTNLIPIVMVTARLAAESQLMSARVGANEFVPKPYTPDQIFNAMSAADSWRRDIEQSHNGGLIELATGREVPSSEEIARLQSLLLARTAWDEEAIRLLSVDLLGMAECVLDWGRRHSISELARMGYAIQRERVTLTLRDTSGWTSANDLPHEHGLGRVIGQGRFDEIRYDDSGAEATLTKHLTPRPQA